MKRKYSVLLVGCAESRRALQCRNYTHVVPEIDLGSLDFDDYDLIILDTRSYRDVPINAIPTYVNNPRCKKGSVCAILGNNESGEIESLVENAGARIVHAPITEQKVRELTERDIPN